MAQTLTLLPSGAGELLDRWRGNLDALARERNVEELKRQEVSFALSAVKSLAADSDRAAGYLAELSAYAGRLAHEIQHAPRLLVRDPEATLILAEMDG